MFIPSRINMHRLMCFVAILATAGLLHAAQPVQGTVQAFGDNSFGQLGNGFEYKFPQASIATGIAKIAGGAQHTLALRNDGTVWAWGNNSAGQLGDGSYTSSTVPVPVISLTNVTAISAGFAFSLALKNDGTVWAWGAGFDGQLGLGPIDYSTVPVQISALTGVTAISAGFYHSLALLGDGTVMAWGDNQYGQLGIGSTTDGRLPALVPNLTGVTAIAAGFAHSFALKGDGSVVAWGFNGDGEFGNGNTTNSNLPVPISALANIASITAGGFHGLAKKNDGTVWVWGKNLNGQLGIGDFINRLTPVQNSSLTGVTALSANYDHSLALAADGSLLAFGENGNAQLGDGTKTSSNVPITVSLTGVTRIAAGEFFSLAVKGDGTVYAWGNDVFGQFGNGRASIESVAVEVPGLSNVTAIASGNNHNLALKNDGTVWAWGSNSNGQLGNGTLVDSTSPVQVGSLSGVVAIACAVNHSLALKSDGTVWAWGSNSNAQLGDGGNTDSNVPKSVSVLAGVTAIAAGGFSGSYSLALKGDGSVWLWGFVAGTVKKNSTNIVAAQVPTQISGLTDITAIAGGGMHLLALKTDKTVWALGNNAHGQLGNGSTRLSTKPVQVKSLANAVGIAAGTFHSLVRLQDGTVMAWGANNGGQLGNLTTKDSRVPVKVLLLNNAVSIAAGYSHSLAVKSGGSVLSWGGNSSSQLGRTTNTFSQSGAAGLVPGQVDTISGTVAVSAGASHSLVLLNAATPAVTSLSPSTILEQLPVGTQVGSLTTFDASGLNKTFTYAFATGDGDTDNASFSLATDKLLTAAVFNFATKSSYSIRIRTTDNLNNVVEKAFTINVLATPNSGTDGTENVSNVNGDDGFVVNPINDLVISMISSNGGVIQLKIDITPGLNELEASTDFEDIPGRSALVTGFTPVHKFIQKGIFVATVTVVEKISRIKVAVGRKMINIDQSETEAPVVNVVGAPRALGKPSSTRIPTTSMEGKFFFGGISPDTVKYVGTFILPAGFNPSQSNEFSFGIGNIIIDTVVDEKGKMTAVANTQHAVNNSYFPKLAIKFSGIRKGQVAVGGETATFSATVLTGALSNKGFDTEGITNAAAKDLVPGQSASRFIQVSYNLSGVAYEDRADVVFVLNTASDFGTISGRVRK
ncbi:MAG: hypothetical protein WCT04_14250 [Planctomycetota bacterium]